MKFLLSGGSGFIGSNLAFHFLNQGHQILNLDKLTYAANIQGFEEYSTDQYQLIQVDLAKLQGKSQIIEQIIKFNPDYVIHLAAESHVDRSFKNNKVFYESNVIGTWAILELLRQLKVQKAIFFSTDEVYGSLALENYEIESFQYGFKEIDKLDPRNPYAGSKAAADQITFSYLHTFGLPICLVRPSNNFGPRQHQEKLIPKAIIKLLQKKRVPLYDSGKNYYREWLHVEDTCSAIEQLLGAGQPGEIYNIGSGIRHSNLEVIELLCQLLSVNFDQAVESVPNRLSHDVAYGVNSEKIRKTGWEPRISLKEGLQKIIQRCHADPTWLESVQKNR